MTYFPMYKCAMCGALLRYGNATKIPYEDQPDSGEGGRGRGG